MSEVRTVLFTDSFKRDYKRLSVDLQRQVDECIKDLYRDTIPASRRRHRINSDRYPKVFSVDVTSNKSHKLSFEYEGKAVKLRRIGTHGEIDRNH